MMNDLTFIARFIMFLAQALDHCADTKSLFTVIARIMAVCDFSSTSIEINFRVEFHLETRQFDKTSKEAA